jgi:hypothetical protein
MIDFCLEPGKIEALKMLDLHKKSATDSNILQVQHQTSHRQFYKSQKLKIMHVVSNLLKLKYMASLHF